MNDAWRMGCNSYLLNQYCHLLVSLLGLISQQLMPKCQARTLCIVGMWCSHWQLGVLHLTFCLAVWIGQVTLHVFVSWFPCWKNTGNDTYPVWTTEVKRCYRSVGSCFSWLLSFKRKAGNLNQWFMVLWGMWISTHGRSLLIFDPLILWINPCQSLRILYGITAKIINRKETLSYVCSSQY